MDHRRYERKPELLLQHPRRRSKVCCITAAFVLVAGAVILAVAVAVELTSTSNEGRVECGSLAALAATAAAADGEPRRLIIHPGPPASPAGQRQIVSSRYSVSVQAVQAAGAEVAVSGGPEAFVYEALNEMPVVDGMPPETHWSMFDLDSGVEVVVDVTKAATSDDPTPWTSCRTLPERYGAACIVVDSGTVRVTQLSQPGHYHVEVNGFSAHDWPLFLFVEPVEAPIEVPRLASQGGGCVVVPVPNASTPGVHYFGPGLHNVSVYEVGAGATVYLAPGAFVYGSIKVTASYGSVVRGRGVLSGEYLTVVDPSFPPRQPDPYRYSGIAFASSYLCWPVGGNECWNLVEGVTVIYPPGFSTDLVGAPGVLATSIKAIAYVCKSSRRHAMHAGEWRGRQRVLEFARRWRCLV